MTLSNASKYVEKVNYSYTSGGNINDIDALANILAVSVKTKYATTIQHSNCTLGIYPKGMRLTFTQKPHMNVCSSFNA